ncbi:MAG: hypothetical protein AAB557_04175 [Patescibacteria group bacterium]
MILYSTWRTVGRTLIIGVLLWKVITLIFATFATQILPLQLAYTIWRDPQYKNFGFYLPYLVSIWGNFDGFFYLAIARDGYLSGQQPFFPLYPVIVRFIALRWSLPFVLAAQIVSLASLSAALIVVVKLLAHDKKLSLFPLIIAVVLTYPTSYSYGATYNDALFFFLTTLTLYLGRTKNFVWAGIAGAAATLTRLNGLALFPFLLVEYALPTDNKWQIKPILTSLRNNFRLHLLYKHRVWAAFFIPLTMLGYLMWIHGQFGSWQTLFTTMSVWGQEKVTFPIQVVWRYLKIFFLHPPATLTYWVAMIELSSVALYTWAIIWSIGKIRASYWIFLTISILIPSFTGTFQGMPRYGLHLYPLFFTLAMALSEQTKFRKTLYFFVTVSMLFFCIILFTRGYFIA